MNKVIVFSIVSGVAGLGAGAGLGYYIAQEKLVKKFDEILEKELANTKKFYERTNKVGRFETPQAAAEALGVPDSPVEEAADAIVNYGAKFVPAEAVEITNEGALVADMNEVGKLMADGLSDGIEAGHQNARNVFGKEEGEPVRITFDEFAQAGDDYDPITVTYYMGDKVVAENDEPIQDDNRCIGLDNLYLFHEDETLTELYVRNDRLKTVYEITRSTGKYSSEVLDLDDDGHQRGSHLQHSDETFERRPRRQRLRDE